LVIVSVPMGVWLTTVLVVVCVVVPFGPYDVYGGTAKTSIAMRSARMMAAEAGTSIALLIFN
jgi:hypothetical protein